jgi:hypothetical protein
MSSDSTERKGPEPAYATIEDAQRALAAGDPDFLRKWARLFARAEGSAAAPAERADLLKRLHGIADGIRLYGTPDHELAADRIDAIGVALAQPVSPAPEPLTDDALRKLWRLWGGEGKRPCACCGGSGWED